MKKQKKYEFSTNGLRVKLKADDYVFYPYHEMRHILIRATQIAHSYNVQIANVYTKSPQFCELQTYNMPRDDVKILFDHWIATAKIWY